MFTTIIVPLDLGSDGDRALPVVRALHELGDVDIELLSISSSSSSSADVDIDELRRRAVANGWPPHVCRVVQADDVAQAIADDVNGRRGALLVMATSAKRPLFGHLLGSVSEAVLRLVERPALLVGPHVPADIHWHRPTPILCIDPETPAADAVDAVTGWTETFSSARPWITEVVPMAGLDGEGHDADGSTPVQRVAALLAEAGVDARPRIIHGGLPEVRLDDFADDVVEPVFVTVSTRWTAGRHWHSTTRQLVHRSTRPVLVVPAGSGPATEGSLPIAADEERADPGRPPPVGLANGAGPSSTVS